jgi:uncharacterized protein
LKLHAQRAPNLNTVTGYGPGYIEINGARHVGHLIVAASSVQPWSVGGFDRLQPQDFEPLLRLQAELVLLGTGPRHRFADPRLVAQLARSGITLESMDTQAACRTYNILLSDGRSVAGAFLQEDPQR